MGYKVKLAEEAVSVTVNLNQVSDDVKAQLNCDSNDRYITIPLTTAFKLGLYYEPIVFHDKGKNEYEYKGDFDYDKYENILYKLLGKYPYYLVIENSDIAIYDNNDFFITNTVFGTVDWVSYSELNGIGETGVAAESLYIEKEIPGKAIIGELMANDCECILAGLTMSYPASHIPITIIGLTHEEMEQLNITDMDSNSYKEYPKCKVKDLKEIEKFVKCIFSSVKYTKSELPIKSNSVDIDDLVDEDFIMEFNDSAKLLKIEEEDDDSIVIYTKPTENFSAMPIITIAKDSRIDKNDKTLKENYKFRLSAVAADDTEMTYNKTIVTKEDLCKAMEAAAGMLDNDGSLRKYSEDVRNAIELL